jgi:hypothetical protein
MKLQDAPDDKLISGYVKIRDARAQRKAAFDADDAADKEKQERIEAEFLRRFSERGTDSTKANGIGTAYKVVRSSATVGDKDVYFNWILEDPEIRMAFIEARANKTAVLQYRTEHEDIPPGINWREDLTVGFRRS